MGYSFPDLTEVSHPGSWYHRVLKRYFAPIEAYQAHSRELLMNTIHCCACPNVIAYVLICVNLSRLHLH